MKDKDLINTRDWFSVDSHYAGRITSFPNGDRLILTQESQVKLLKENNRRVRAQQAEEAA